MKKVTNKKEITEEIKSKLLKTRISLDFPIALGRSVFILRGTDEETIENGIIIPESSDMMKSRGTICAVGPDVQSTLIDFEGNVRKIQPRDRVLFNTYANLNIIHHGINYVVVSEMDVYAVLPENTTTMTEKLPSRKGKKVNWEG